MSKSLDNGIDPADIVEEFGADALRFMLIHGSAPGNDMRFQQERVEQARNFANKIWNASRFVLMNMEGYTPGTLLTGNTALSLPDRWILSRLQQVTTAANEALARYDFGEALGSLYSFLWDEYCDWYIEISKPRLQGDRADERLLTQSVLLHVLQTTLEMLHPFMPFISEEIWQHLPKADDTHSIMVTAWPKEDASLLDAAAERNMAAVMEGVRSIRNLRAELNVPPGRKISIQLLPNTKEGQMLAEQSAAVIQRLANSGSATVITEGEIPEKALTIAITGLTIYLPLAEMIDIEAEKARLAKELAALEAEIERLQSRLQNPSFLEKAPQAVVEQERTKLADYLNKKQTLEERRAQLTMGN